MNTTDAKLFLLDFHKKGEHASQQVRRDLAHVDPPESTEEYGKDPNGNPYHTQREIYKGTKIIVHLYNAKITNVEPFE